jgi:hypothetical protein
MLKQAQTGTWDSDKLSKPIGYLALKRLSGSSIEAIPFSFLQLYFPKFIQISRDTVTLFKAHSFQGNIDETISVFAVHRAHPRYAPRVLACR